MFGRTVGRSYVSAAGNPASISSSAVGTMSITAKALTSKWSKVRVSTTACLRMMYVRDAGGPMMKFGTG